MPRRSPCALWEAAGPPGAVVARQQLKGVCQATWGHSSGLCQRGLCSPAALFLASAAARQSVPRFRFQNAERPWKPSDATSIDLGAADTMSGMSRNWHCGARLLFGSFLVMQHRSRPRAGLGDRAAEGARGPGAAAAELCLREQSRCFPAFQSCEQQEEKPGSFRGVLSIAYFREVAPVGEEQGADINGASVCLGSQRRPTDYLVFCHRNAFPSVNSVIAPCTDRDAQAAGRLRLKVLSGLI